MAHFDSLATVRRLAGTQSVRLKLRAWGALYQNNVGFTDQIIRQVRDVLIQAGYDEIKLTSRAPAEATCLLRLVKAASFHEPPHVIPCLRLSVQREDCLIKSCRLSNYA